MGMFSFDASRETPAMLENRRLRAAILANRIGSGPAGVGSGIGDLFRGLGAGLSNYRTDQNEMAGNAYDQSAFDHLSSILDAPPAPGIAQPPSNDAVRSGIRQSMSTGQPAQLAVYSPPQAGQGPDSGVSQPNRPPSMAMAYPGGDGITQADQGGVFQPNTNGAQPIPQPMSDNSMNLSAAQQPAPMNPAVQPIPQPMTAANPNAALIPEIYKYLQNPWASDAHKAIVSKRLEAIQQQSDPAYQLKMKTDQLQYDHLAHPDQIPMTALQKAQLADAQLGVTKNTMTVDQMKQQQAAVAQYAASLPPQARQAITAYPELGQSFAMMNNGMGGMYDTKSIEGTALNYLIQTGKITRDQAANFASGKPYVGANGQQTFMTPQDIVGAAVQNGFDPQNAPGAQGGNPNAPQSGGQPSNGQRGIPLTGPKPTEYNQKMILLAGQSKQSGQDALNNFDELATVGNTIGANVPGGRMMQTGKGQVGTDGIRNVIANWLYATSGATANPAEIKTQVGMVIPTMMDKPEAIVAKKARLQSIVNELDKSAAPFVTQQDAPAPLSDEDLLKKYGG